MHGYFCFCPRFAVAFRKSTQLYPALIQLDVRRTQSICLSSFQVSVMHKILILADRSVIEVHNQYGRAVCSNKLVCPSAWVLGYYFALFLLFTHVSINLHVYNHIIKMQLEPEAKRYIPLYFSYYLCDYGSRSLHSYAFPKTAKVNPQCCYHLSFHLFSLAIIAENLQTLSRMSDN